MAAAGPAVPRNDLRARNRGGGRRGHGRSALSASKKHQPVSGLHGLKSLFPMKTKSSRHRRNQEVESRLLDHDLIEQRALQISRIEGHDFITEDDRQRAREELMAPHEPMGEPEISPDMEPQITAWDEAPASSGTRAPKVKPEDEASIRKELAEKGLRGPRRTRQGEGPLRRTSE